MLLSCLFLWLLNVTVNHSRSFVLDVFGRSSIPPDFFCINVCSTGDSDMASSSILHQQRKEEAKTRRRKKKTNSSLVATTFQELYHLTGEVLGEGAYASVRTCRNVWTDIEYAVKIIEKVPGHSRSRVFKEIEMFHHCRGHKNIIQLIEYFEESERFYLVFEKINGGQLLDHIQNRVKFTEKEACYVVKDLSAALQFLHRKGEDEYSINRI